MSEGSLANMSSRYWCVWSLSMSLLMACPLLTQAGSVELLPLKTFRAAHALASPLANAAFAPGEGALPAAPFAGVLTLHAASMQTLPVLDHPLILGRDVRIFPGVRLEFFTLGDMLVPVERGEMVP